MSAYNPKTPIRTQVDSLEFGLHTSSSIRALSAVEVVSSVAFDNLGNPLKGGLYDDAMGPWEMRTKQQCTTCGQSFSQCPGHLGHIELSVPVFNPLTFTNLLQFLKVKCQCCHSFRLQSFHRLALEAKLSLIENNRTKEAMNLDDLLATMLKTSKATGKKKTVSQLAAEEAAGNSAASNHTTEVENFLKGLITPPVVNPSLTSHERQLQRTLVKAFIKANGTYSVRCQNCDAYSHALRQDASNKIFRKPLAKASLKKNVEKKLRIRAAEAITMTEEANIVPDDSDSDTEDEDEIMALNADDKYLTQLEIMAQVRLTWRKHPSLCSRIFGSAMDNTAKPWNIFFTQVIAVPPNRFRPAMELGSMKVEHSQNHYLNKMLQTNEKLREAVALSSLPAADSDESDDDAALAQKAGTASNTLGHWIDLQTTVNCYYDSSKDPQGSAGTNPPGIRQLLERKEGIFRKHMMGKRVNYACRSVISPDNNIGTNEIGVPLKFAKTLDYPTPVTQHNVEQMRQAVRNGPDIYPGANYVETGVGMRMSLAKMSAERREALANRLLSHEEGQMTVGRQLLNGDSVLVNRQPTLHKPGIMAHVVRVLHNPTQRTLRMHYANCNTYNADFDGDEMNCHFPQNDLARSESENIASNDLQYNAPTDGSPLRGLIQDHVDGGVKLCSKDTFLDREQYMQLVFSALTTLPGLEVLSYDDSIEFMPPAMIKPVPKWTGKQVVSTLLQQLRRTKFKDQRLNPTRLPGISMERKAKTPASAFGEHQQEHLIVIRDGELLRGVLDKAAFGATEFSLVHAVHEAYGPHKAGLLLNSLGRLFSHYLQSYAMHSCRMEDLVLKKEANERRTELGSESYNVGMRCASAWANAEGGKTEIQDKNLPNTPLPEGERRTAAMKIHQLLSGKEGPTNAAQLDAYMQSKLNPLASEIIKSCLPDGLVVPFPHNTFSLMVLTGAKGSMVNQSQVSCGLGQQALEGRRVPRMSSGRTLPSFDAYDPNPRADGFITDRFLTGIRPQEYYFHCMAGREGLVDTAVKTSRSGYLQRCLVKHLEELTVHYDYTVRDAEGNVIQFLYGEDSIDPTKAAHLDCSSATLLYMARNAEALKQQYHTTSSSASSKTSLIDGAYEDAMAALAAASPKGKGMLLTKSMSVLARRLRNEGDKCKDKNFVAGWKEATIKKAKGGVLEIQYKEDKAKASMPAQFVKPLVRDPLIGRGDKKHMLGSHATCVSEKVALKVKNALANDVELRQTLKQRNLSEKDFLAVIAAKYSSALVAPGEAVGSIAAQSVGEPSTQMTLNTFHLAGHGGANVTLGIPRLREIIMSAARELKTPTMNIPFREGVSEQQQTRTSRKFLKLTLKELLSNEDGISVETTLKQGDAGVWQRFYTVKLKLHPEERIKEAFGISLEEIATEVANKFHGKLSYSMNAHLRKAKAHDGELGNAFVSVPKGSGVGLTGDGGIGGDGEEEEEGEEKKSAKKRKELQDKAGSDSDAEEEEEKAGQEDGVMGGRGMEQMEQEGYGEEDEEDAELKKKGGEDIDDIFGGDEDDEADEEEKKEEKGEAGSPVKKKKGRSEEEGSVGDVMLNRKTSELTLPPISVDVTTRPLILTDLCELAASQVVVRQEEKITRAAVIDGEKGARILQTEGCNFEKLFRMSDELVDHSQISSNDIWAIHQTYGVEAACASIGGQITSVFAVYGIEVDPRHLSLISDYMTFNGEYKPMNRRGMVDGSSAFLQMSFETTATFMTAACLKGQKEELNSPSANIVLGNPIKAGTGAFECIVKN